MMKPNEKIPPKGKAIVSVPIALLHKLLGLPDHANITNVCDVYSHYAAFNVVVEANGLPSWPDPYIHVECMTIEDLLKKISPQPGKA